MVQEKLEVIQTYDITNNCPKCFSQDMKLTFYQKHNYSKLSHKITNEISHKIQCKKCNSFIYPIDWTADIERIFDYKRKMVTPKKASVKYTGLFYGLVFLSIAVVAGLIATLSFFI